MIMLGYDNYKSVNVIIYKNFLVHKIELVSVFELYFTVLVTSFESIIVELKRKKNSIL